MNTSRLFHRNFTIMVLGQIASLFGNAILRFALSLYVLDQTGSAAIFGSILAISMVPTILLSPVGGVLADRVNRRNIMVALDSATALLIGTFYLLMRVTDSLALIAVLMVLLAVIQSFYQPSVQSSIPCLTSEENLMKANGVVIQINALANLLGPILGGFLYGYLGLTPILLASLVCFFLSATMELFLKIPFQRQKKQGSPLRAVTGDLKDALHFLTKDSPVLMKMLLVVAGINLFLSAMIIVGLPFLVKIFLGLSDQHYGFAEAAMGVGSIVGGCLAGLVSKRVSFQRSHFLLFGSSLFLIPLGLSVITNRSPLVSYAIVLFAVLGCMSCATLFTIFAQTFAQRLTPNHLLGKAAAFITTMSMCALPIGQALYGFLFDALKDSVWIVVLFAALVSLLLSVLARKVLKRFPSLDAPQDAEPGKPVPVLTESTE